VFTDRKDAGIRLARKLQAYRGAADLVIGLARGGIAVAAPVAASLHIPLDALAVKKIGSPGNPELAIGARVKPTPLQIKGLNVILADDGVATGLTIEAGINWLKRKRAKKIIVAVPVAAKDSAARLKTLADEWICLHEADDLYAVGQFYKEFGQ